MATSSAQDVPVFREAQVLQEPWELAYKRALDLLLVISAHLVLLPLFLLFWIAIPVAIWLDDPGPVLHKRRWVGTGGKPFPMLKVRTVVVESDHAVACGSG